jgi:hypothetical protein
MPGFLPTHLRDHAQPSCTAQFYCLPLSRARVRRLGPAHFVVFVECIVGSVMPARHKLREPVAPELDGWHAALHLATCEPVPGRIPRVKRERGGEVFQPPIRGCPRNCKRRVAPHMPLHTSVNRAAGRRDATFEPRARRPAGALSPFLHAGCVSERIPAAATAELKWRQPERVDEQGAHAIFQIDVTQLSSRANRGGPPLASSLDV